MRSFFAWGRRFGADPRGVAVLEFALALPVALLMLLSGAELANFITVKMRVSQLALRLADDAARMGNGELLAAKIITETDINDLFIGADLQSQELHLNDRGRVTLYQVEPMANPNTQQRYKIGWTRCYGTKATHISSYGRAGDTDLTGIGPTGRQTTGLDESPIMFVEVYYEYKPLLSATLVPTITLTETASMAVRDRRDLTLPIPNPGNETVATCPNN